MGKLLLTQMGFGSGTEVFGGSCARAAAAVRTPGAAGGNTQMQVAHRDSVCKLPLESQKTIILELYTIFLIINRLISNNLT